jgi:hypothetical protein
VQKLQFLAFFFAVIFLAYIKDQYSFNRNRYSCRSLKLSLIVPTLLRRQVPQIARSGAAKRITGLEISPTLLLLQKNLNEHLKQIACEPKFNI